MSFFKVYGTYGFVSEFWHVTPAAPGGALGAPPSPLTVDNHYRSTGPASWDHNQCWGSTYRGLRHL